MHSTNLTRPTMLGLPAEVLDLVMDHSPRSSIHALCLTSRDLNRLATRHLYTHLSLTGRDFRYLRALALLLWTSPAHAALVRSFAVRRAYGGDLDAWPACPQLGMLVKGLVGQYVRESEEGEWERRVTDGVDALPIASLLLRSLPNVEVMQFDGFMLVDPLIRKRVDEGVSF